MLAVMRAIDGEDLGSALYNAVNDVSAATSLAVEAMGGIADASQALNDTSGIDATASAIKDVAAEAPNAAKSVDDMSNKIEDLGKTTKVNMLAEKFKALKDKIMGTSDSLVETKDSAENLGKNSGIENFTSKLLAANIAAKLLQSILSLIKSKLDSAFSRLDTMEQFNRTMTVLTGSAETAAAALENVTAVVKGTAYGLDVAASAVQSFVTSGVSVGTATSHIEGLANAVSFYGDGTNEALESVSSAWSKMLTSGKVSSEKVQSLLDAGIPVWKIYADAVGMSVADVQAATSSGAISAQEFSDTLIAALENGTENFPSIANAAQEAGASWSGTFDNMGANVTRGVANIITATDSIFSLKEAIAGFGKMMEDALNGVATFMTDNAPLIVNTLAVIAGALILAATASAVAWAISNWQLLLLIAVLAMVASWLTKMGYTAEEVCSAIGGFFGGLFATIYNIGVNLYNAIAAFVNFFGNVFDDPLGAVARLFQKVFDSILGIVESVAGAIDALFGTDWASAVSKFRNKLDKLVTDTFGEEEIYAEYKDEVDINDWIDKGSELGASLGKALDENLGNLSDLNPIGDLGGSGLGVDLSGVGDAADALSNAASGSGSSTALQTTSDEPFITDEDIKLLADLATRSIKIEYQQITPEIVLQDVIIRESADIDEVLDRTADWLMEYQNGSLVTG